MQFTNEFGISLPMAVWLLHDEYDYINESKYISATTLLKPIKQIILSKRVPKEERQADVADFMASSLGVAVHDSIEKAWLLRGPELMLKLGYPKEVTDRIRVNPSDEDLAADPNIIPVFMEQRLFREIEGYKIGGKFDMVIDGRLFDVKTTSVYKWILGGGDNDYRNQGSIYRWLDNGKRITSDHIFIQFLFTDYSNADARTNPKYPPLRIQEYPVELMSLDDTESFIRERVLLLDRLWDAPESQIPDCTDEELWRSAPVYKYYSDPSKVDGRASRVFDTPEEANKYRAEKGKGVVLAFASKPKRCEYCAAFSVCTQKDQYYANP